MAVWTFDLAFSGMVADMGPYLGLDAPPQSPTSFPTSIRQIDWLVSAGGVAPPSADYAQHSIFRNADGTLNDFTQGGQTIPATPRFYVVVYNDAFTSFTPSFTPESVTPPGYAAGGTAPNIVLPPAPSTNDAFAARTVMTGSNALSRYNMTGATVEAGEDTAGGTGTRSLWWEWTAPFTGRAYFQSETFGDEAGLLLCLDNGAVTTAEQATTQQVSNASRLRLARIGHDVTAGQRYFLQVSSVSSLYGKVRIYSPVLTEWEQPADTSKTASSAGSVQLGAKGPDGNTAQFESSCLAALAGADSGIFDTLEALDSHRGSGTGVIDVNIGAVVRYRIRRWRLEATGVPGVGPAGTVSVEYESPQGVPLTATLTGKASVTAGNGAPVGSPALVVIPWADSPASLTGSTWRTPSYWSARTLLATFPPGLTAFSTAFALEGVATFVDVAATVEELRTGAAWPQDNTETISVVNTTTQVGVPVLVFTYRPPRRRYHLQPAEPSGLAGRIPLRQVQRNDGLALGAPRQINRSSLQRSLRQGPRTYR